MQASVKCASESLPVGRQAVGGHAAVAGRIAQQQRVGRGCLCHALRTALSDLKQ